jgi:outer membrane protein, multidrug efflux system
MRRRLLAIAISAALAGCAAVGPDYQRPEIRSSEQWRIDIQQANSLVNTRWWDQFRDPVLNELIQTALRENKDVQIAAARIEEFQGRYGVTRGDQFPQVGANADGSRTRGSESGGGSLGENPANRYQVDLGLSFELDFWGKLRRATEAARAEVLASEEARRTVILTLVSELANSYVRLLDFDQQLAITRATLKTRQESVRINLLRFQAGLISELDYQQAVAEFHAAAVQVPLLERQIAQQENAISLLLGQNPGGIRRGVTLAQLAPPAVPGGLPSDLLARRPDRGGQGGIFPHDHVDRIARNRQSRFIRFIHRASANLAVRRPTGPADFYRRPVGGAVASGRGGATTGGAGLSANDSERLRRGG